VAKSGSDQQGAGSSTGEGGGGGGMLLHVTDQVGVITVKDDVLVLTDMSMV
jgi:hypothetical protein